MHRRFIGLSIILTLIQLLASGPARGEEVIVGFNGFPDGTILRDQFWLQGVRMPEDPNGGPFAEDAGLLSFLLHTPPILLSLNPDAVVSVPSQVFASVGTYEFDFVDPEKPIVESFTDHVEVVVAFADEGETVLTAFDSTGLIIAQDTLFKFSFTFGTNTLSVSAPGIQKVTLTTPLIQPTIGALVDTLTFNRPAVLPARAISIDVKGGARRDVISLAAPEVSVAVLSDGQLQPARLDPDRILFQLALPTAHSLRDVNHDFVPDLIVRFRTSELQHLERGTVTVELIAVDTDGTPLRGTAEVRVVGRVPDRAPPFINSSEGLDPTGGLEVQPLP